LGGGPPRFKPDFTCPTLLRILLPFKSNFTYGTITLYGGPFQVPLAIRIEQMAESYNPYPRRDRFGLFPFRSPLLRESRFLSFPGLLRCFNSPSNPPEVNFRIPPHDGRWVSPFGNLRVNACLAARRSLSQLAMSFIEISSRGIHFTLFCNLIYYALSEESTILTIFNKQLLEVIVYL
jgi:hypothetical protein